MALYNHFENNPFVSKQDFQKLVIDLYLPLAKYQSTEGAVVDINDGAAFYDMRASYIEAVARPLWGIVPLVVGGGVFPYWDNISKAIIAGTDPSHAEYWGETKDSDQRSVEMGAFGFMLMFTPEPIQEHLTHEQLERFAKWLSKIQTVALPPTNWLFFVVLVQEGLKNIGLDKFVNQEYQDKLLEKLSNMYLGDGWYGDGDPKAIDHYGGFALHSYGLLFAKKKPEHELSKIFIKRAELFAEKFKYWFADSGEGLMIGRSLTYRFAMSAYWGALAVNNLEPLPLKQIKHLWLQQIKSWKGKSIFSPDGVLTRGFFYQNLQVCEPYNSPTSAYWAMKAFLPLMLDDSADFWAVEPEHVTYESPIKAMPTAQHIMQRIDGHSIAHSAGPVHEWLQIDKYNKFAYSTHFGMDTSSLLYAQTNSFGDNILAFSFDNGDNWQMKNRTLSTQVFDDCIISEWESGKIIVKTTIKIDGGGYFTRTHEFEVPEESIVIESSFALDKWQVKTDVFSIDNSNFIINRGLNLLSGDLNSGTTNASIFAKNINGFVGLLSKDQYKKVAFVCDRTNTNVASPQTTVPFLRTKLKPGKHKLVTQYIATTDLDFTLNDLNTM
jgi:hypothetical protein